MSVTGTGKILTSAWARFWMLFAGMSRLGRVATWIATWFAPPYHGRDALSWWNPKGYISPRAVIHHNDVHLGSHVFIDDRVLIYQARGGGLVEVGERVHLYRDSIIQNGHGGNVRIGARTYIQPRCMISAFQGPIDIGCGVEIAPNCSFYSYNHGFSQEEPISQQPLHTKGGIVIEDGVWIGVGVIVLDGVRIGEGAVIGAGSVVTTSVPPRAIAVGVPARVVRMRDGMPRNVKENEYARHMGK
jgi:acetyltransferase-like isoleucine patch superfamily enzyme